MQGSQIRYLMVGENRSPFHGLVNVKYVKLCKFGISSLTDCIMSVMSVTLKCVFVWPLHWHSITINRIAFEELYI